MESESLGIYCDSPGGAGYRQALLGPNALGNCIRLRQIASKDPRISRFAPTVPGADSVRVEVASPFGTIGSLSRL